MRITEVARYARVSTATVSRTINRTGTVRPDTAEKVWRVVRKLGYHPDTNARALVSGRSHQLGLIISDIANPFFPELVKSFEEIALRNGFEVLVANTGYDTERMSQSVRRMLERKVDGVAVITSEMKKELIAQMERRRLPMVFLDTGRVRDHISNIKVHYGTGIREAMEHLVHLGHERIGFISGPLDLRSAHDPPLLVSAMAQALRPAARRRADRNRQPQDRRRRIRDAAACSLARSGRPPSSRPTTSPRSAPCARSTTRSSACPKISR